MHDAISGKIFWRMDAIQVAAAVAARRGKPNLRGKLCGKPCDIDQSAVFTPSTAQEEVRSVVVTLELRAAPLCKVAIRCHSHWTEMVSIGKPRFECINSKLSLSSD